MIDKIMKTFENVSQAELICISFNSLSHSLKKLSLENKPLQKPDIS